MNHVPLDPTTQRKFITKGLYVLVEDSINQEEHYGFVHDILSKKDDPRGILVRLQNGTEGRVLEIPTPEKLKQLNFKFYNLFFHDDLYLIRHRKTQENIIVPLQQKGQTLRTVFLSSTANPETLKLKKEWYWKKISQTKVLHKLFKGNQVDLFILNQQRQLTYEQFKALEIQFKQLQP